MSKATPSEKPQDDRFNETARALGCDEDEAVFDEKLKAIAKQKPKEKVRLIKRDWSGLRVLHGARA